MPSSSHSTAHTVHLHPSPQLNLKVFESEDTGVAYHSKPDPWNGACCPAALTKNVSGMNVGAA